MASDEISTGFYRMDYNGRLVKVFHHDDQAAVELAARRRELDLKRPSVDTTDRTPRESGDRRQGDQAT